MNKLIVFDVDGTILDSVGFFEGMLVAYSRENGLPHPCLETYRIGYADPRNHDFKWGITRDEQVRHLHAAWDFSDRVSMSGDPALTPLLFQGVEETLRALKKDGHTLGIVTSKQEAPLRHFLSWHAIGDLFSSVRTLGDVKKRGEKEKPAPDMLLSVMRELDFTPQDTVMVGDTVMDIRMGLAAGVHTIGVTWGAHTHERLVQAGAHKVIHKDFQSVIPSIQEFFTF